MATTFLQIEDNQRLLDEILQQTKVELRSLVEARLRQMVEDILLEVTDEAMRRVSGRLHAYHDDEKAASVFNLVVNLRLEVE